MTLARRPATQPITLPTTATPHWTSPSSTGIIISQVRNRRQRAGGALNQRMFSRTLALEPPGITAVEVHSWDQPGIAGCVLSVLPGIEADLIWLGCGLKSPYAAAKQISCGRRRADTNLCAVNTYRSCLHCRPCVVISTQTIRCPRSQSCAEQPVENRK
jgi:hypothetical protein